MARIRTVKPEFWRHEELSALPEPTHMLACALLNYSDDDGYFNANPKLIQAECSPLREPSVSIQDSLNMLAKAGFLQLGTGDDGKRYGRIVKFGEHQRINRPTESKIKKIPTVWDESPTPHTQVTEPSPPEGKGKEGNREGKEGGEAPPLKDQLFGPCLQWLAEKSKRPEKEARTVIGKWVSKFGDGPVLAAFMDAQRCTPIEPMAWIFKALSDKQERVKVITGGRPAGGKPISVEQFAAQQAADYEKWARENGGTA